MFKIRSGKALCTAWVMTVPKPAMATRSTRWARSLAVTASVYAARSKSGPNPP